MFDRWLAALLHFMQRNSRSVLLSAALLIALSSAGLYFTRYEGSIELMLPPDREISRSMNFLRDSNLSDKVIVSLALTSPDKTKKDLFNAADQLAASLSSPVFTKVTTGVATANMMDGLFSDYAPQMLGSQDLAAIDSRLTRAFVSEKMQKIYMQSLRPESVFMVPMLRADPLGINMVVLEKMKALPSSMGYDVSVEDGHFISSDGRHAMLIIQTKVKMTDGPESKKLLDELDRQLRLLPGYISADVVSGHRHTVSNENVIKRDIGQVSVLVSIVFLVLFLVIFRDVRVVLVYIIPFISVVLAINLCYLAAGRLSYLVMGFGTAIAGISVDYGLMIYISARKGADQARTLNMTKLLIINATTTAFGFSALYFSKIEGYHQLALFSILCVIISVCFALFILPLTLRWQNISGIRQPEIGTAAGKSRSFRMIVISIWVVVTVAAAILSAQVKVQSDIKQLDGSEPEVIRAEKNFHDVWGGKSSQAVFVVSGRNFEEAMKVNDDVFNKVSASGDSEHFSSFSLFWSAEETRRKNLEQWKEFWRGKRETKLRELIRAESGKYGFSEEAFKPFFENLYSASADSGKQADLISSVKERFVQQRPDAVRLLSFFPDDKQMVERMSQLAADYPGAFIVSGTALSEAISGFTAKEARLLAPIAVMYNILLTWLFFRNVRETLISLIPLLTGMLCLTGIMALLGQPLNVVSIVAAIITSGVIVDYGIGRTFDHRHNSALGTRLVVTLSAATNIIGAGGLLFAKHPAFFSTGLAMVICMTAGYLSAMFVVPAFCSLGPSSAQQGSKN